MDDIYHKETIDVWKTKVAVQVIMPDDHSKQDQHNQRKQLKRCDHTDTNKEDQVYYDNNSDDDTFHDAVQGVQQINDQVYYDSNSNDGNENYDDTFHDSIQAEDMINDTHNDNDDVNRKPINNMMDYGEQRLTLYIINYDVSDLNAGNGLSLIHI